MDANTPPPPPPSDDALEHLWNAAHEFLRGMRGLIDAAEQFVEHQRGARPHEADGREPRVQHIDIDLDLDAESHADRRADTDAS